MVLKKAEKLEPIAKSPVQLRAKGEVIPDKWHYRLLFRLSICFLSFFKLKPLPLFFPNDPPPFSFLNLKNRHLTYLFFFLTFSDCERTPEFMQFFPHLEPFLFTFFFYVVPILGILIVKYPLLRWHKRKPKSLDL
jgi:hypothetical protein